MKKTHHFIAATIFLLNSCFLSAQILPVKNAFQTDLANVINEYPNHFKFYLGDQLAKKTPNLQTIVPLLQLRMRKNAPLLSTVLLIRKWFRGRQ